MSKKIDRTGEIGYNNYGTKMVIVQYIDNKKAIIEFQDEYKYKTATSYSCFAKGNVSNPYDKTVFNIGYLGEGEIDKNIYSVWSSMIKRCYTQKQNIKQISYVGCEVCEEWHNFQNFAKWYEENYYKVEGQRMHLDKDILYKNNKIYSPQTCIFVPERINTLFVNCTKSRGEYPVGVTYNKDNDMFHARCRVLEGEKSKTKHIGYYNTSFEAFISYKKFKENYIKRIADEYKEFIPNKLYEAMYKYEIEIDD